MPLILILPMIGAMSPAEAPAEAPALAPAQASPPPVQPEPEPAVRHRDPEVVIDLTVEDSGLFVGLQVSRKEQWDHRVEGKPFVCHQKYLTVDGYGCRRLAFGATPGEALALGEINARDYPLTSDIPLSRQVNGAAAAALIEVQEELNKLAGKLAGLWAEAATASPRPAWWA